MKIVCKCENETELEYNSTGNNTSSGKEYIDYYNLKFDKKKFQLHKAFQWNYKQSLIYIKCRVCGDELCLGALKKKKG